MQEIKKRNFKSINLYLRVILISFLPILTYLGLSETDLTSWGALYNVLIDFVKNPYLMGLYFFTLYQSFKNTAKGV